MKRIPICFPHKHISMVIDPNKPYRVMYYDKDLKKQIYMGSYESLELAVLNRIIKVAQYELDKLPKKVNSIKKHRRVRKLKIA